MEKPICLGFDVLSTLLIYETYRYKLQQCCGEENFHLHCMHTESFAISVKIDDIMKDLQKLNESYDFWIWLKTMIYTIVIIKKF